MAPKTRRGKRGAEEPLAAESKKQKKQNAKVNGPEDDELPLTVKNDKRKQIDSEETVDADSQDDQLHEAATTNRTIPSASQQIQQEAYDRFEPLFAAARRLAGDDFGTEPFVKIDELLGGDQVIVPIMAVTEAIKYRTNPADPQSELQHFFDVTSDTRVAIARTETSSALVNVESVRPGRPLLIPWIYNSEVMRAIRQGTRDMRKLSKNLVKEDAEHRSHIFLLLIRMELGRCEVRFFDSYPQLGLSSDPRIWPHLVQTIHTAIRNMQWLPGGRTVVNEGERDANGYDDHFGPEIQALVAQQSAAWDCGFHTILNAWTIAMNLQPNPNFRIGGDRLQRFHERTRDMINLAVRGLVDSNLIYAFLVGHGFALPSKRRNQCPSFGNLNRIHKIRDAGLLNVRVQERHAIETRTRTETRTAAPTCPLPPRPTARPPGRPTHQVPQQHAQLRPDNRVQIEPAVMAQEILGNADCWSAWAVMNSTEDGRSVIDHSKYANNGSVLNFIEYYNWLLGGSATSEFDREEHTRYFEYHRGRLDWSLNFPAELIQPQTSIEHDCMGLQLRIHRMLAKRQFISMNGRNQLFHSLDRLAKTVRLQDINAQRMGLDPARNRLKSVGQDLFESPVTKRTSPRTSPRTSRPSSNEGRGRSRVSRDQEGGQPIEMTGHEYEHEEQTQDESEGDDGSESEREW